MNILSQRRKMSANRLAKSPAPLEPVGRLCGAMLQTLCVLSFLCVGGCNPAENPGTWGVEKVSAKIQESLELTDVELTANPEGGFTGTGSRTDGETVTFTITQDPTASRMSWDAEGDRGFVEDGYYELK